MSHFSVIAAVPTTRYDEDKDEHVTLSDDEVESRLADMLKPYDENDLEAAQWFGWGPKKWDWWVEGGRWRGGLGGANRLPVKEVIPKIQSGEIDASFALLTPNGWQEKAQIGWFARRANAKEEGDWLREIVGTLRQFEGHLAILLDCHI